MKINRLEIWQALTQLTLMCQKCMKGMFNPNVTWYSYVLTPSQSFYKKGAKSLENFLIRLWKWNLFDFIEISRNLYANTNPSLMKTETFYAVVLLSGTNLGFVDYKY